MLMVSMSSCRRDLAVDVHDVRVVEGADHLADRVGLADVGQELVAQALALAGALDDAGDVDERHRRRDDPAEPKISASTSSRGSGTPDDADVGLDRGERVVRGEHVVLGQRVEQGGLADVGQADDADGESPRAASLRSVPPRTTARSARRAKLSDPGARPSMRMDVTAVAARRRCCRPARLIGWLLAAARAPASARRGRAPQAEAAAAAPTAACVRRSSSAERARERGDADRAHRRRVTRGVRRAVGEALERNNEAFVTLAEARLGTARAAAEGDLAQRQQAIDAWSRRCASRWTGAAAAAVSSRTAPAPTRRCASRSARCARRPSSCGPRPPSWSPPCAHRRCAGAGARCSSNASSRRPA